MKTSTKNRERLKTLAKIQQKESCKKSIVGNDIEYKISLLKSRIKNCDYDLQTHFKDNITIINKREDYKRQLEVLENENRNL